jgi:hypothetical protein
MRSSESRPFSLSGMLGVGAFLEQDSIKGSAVGTISSSSLTRSALPFLSFLLVNVHSRSSLSHNWHGRDKSGMLQRTLRVRQRSHGRCDLDRYRLVPATVEDIEYCDGSLINWLMWLSIIHDCCLKSNSELQSAQQCKDMTGGASICSLISGLTSIFEQWWSCLTQQPG